MDLKIIKPVDSTAKSAAISKYSPDREGGNSGQRQQPPDSYRPKTEKKELSDFDKFFAGTAKKSTNEVSEFELLLKKAWEENNRMQESAKALDQTANATINPLALESAWFLGLRGNFRQIKK